LLTYFLLYVQLGQRPQLPPDLEKLRFPEPEINDMATLSADEVDMLSTIVRLFYSCTDPSPSKRPSSKEVFSALESALAKRACTTSTYDGPIEEAVTALELPKKAFAVDVEKEPSSPKKKNVLVGSKLAETSSCNGGQSSEENNLRHSDSESSEEK
jgi:hypothetical protein